MTAWLVSQCTTLSCIRTPPGSDPRLSDERLHRLTMNSDSGLMQARDEVYDLWTSSGNNHSKLRCATSRGFSGSFEAQREVHATRLCLCGEVASGTKQFDIIVYDASSLQARSRVQGCRERLLHPKQQMPFRLGSR